MRIANVENNTLNWVSTLSVGKVDMTHCDFSARSAREERRHIIGGSEPDVINGSNKKQNSECRRRTRSLGILVRTVRNASGARSLLCA